jgi:hypothetical protein
MRERHADGDLPLPRGGAHQQQVRHVGAGDQQHQADRAEKEQQLLAHVAHHRFLERRDGHRAELVLLRELEGEPAPDHVRLRPHLGERGAGRQAGDGAEVDRAAGLDVVGLKDERHPDVGGARELRPLPQDADQRIGLAVQGQRAAEHAGIGAEAAAPELLRDHRHAGSLGVVLARREGAPGERADAHHLEEVGAHPGRLQALGLGAPAAQVQGAAVMGGGVREGVAGRPPVEEVGDREGGLLLSLLADEVGAHQTLRRPEGERAEHHAVDHAEDRRGGADAESERRHRHQREAGALPQLPAGEPEVLAELRERLPPQHPSLLPHPQGAAIRPGPLEIAKPPPRLHPRLLRRPALLGQLRGHQLEMEPQLLLDLRRHLGGTAPGEPESAARHRRQAVSSTLETAATYVRQLDTSAWSAERPSSVKR